MWEHQERRTEGATSEKSSQGANSRQRTISPEYREKLRTQKVRTIHRPVSHPNPYYYGHGRIKGMCKTLEDYDNDGWMPGGLYDKKGLPREDARRGSEEISFGRWYSVDLIGEDDEG